MGWGTKEIILGKRSKEQKSTIFKENRPFFAKMVVDIPHPTMGESGDVNIFGHFSFFLFGESKG